MFGSAEVLSENISSHFVHQKILYLYTFFFNMCTDEMVSDIDVFHLVAVACSSSEVDSTLIVHVQNQR